MNPSPDSNDTQQIRDLVATWATATEACDIELIKPLMDEDILFFTAGHEPFGSETFVQRFIGNVQQLCPKVRADVREIEVRGTLHLRAPGSRSPSRLPEASHSSARATRLLSTGGVPVDHGSSGATPISSEALKETASAFEVTFC